MDRVVYLRETGEDTYRTAGDYNLFMMCEAPRTAAFRALPEGYTFRHCIRGETELWIQIAAEEQYAGYVREFYKKVYGSREDEFFNRCSFVCDPEGTPVSTCMLWQAYRKIETVHWFRTLPEHEGKGLGRTLLSILLKDAAFPVYLHTQPTSARAIRLYSDFGFVFIADAVVGSRTNHLDVSLPILKKVMPEDVFASLRTCKAPPEFLEAACSNQTAEF